MTRSMAILKKRKLKYKNCCFFFPPCNETEWKGRTEDPLRFNLLIRIGGDDTGVYGLETILHKMWRKLRQESFSPEPQFTHMLMELMWGTKWDNAGKVLAQFNHIVNTQNFSYHHSHHPRHYPSKCSILWLKIRKITFPKCKIFL